MKNSNKLESPTKKVRSVSIATDEDSYWERAIPLIDQYIDEYYALKKKVKYFFIVIYGNVTRKKKKTLLQMEQKLGLMLEIW